MTAVNPDKLTPMQGVRVSDVDNFLAGPYAATIVGEFGAEVIKVEPPGGSDLLQPAGVQLFLKLVAKSDVLGENFLPSMMKTENIFGDRQFHARRNMGAMDAPDTGEQTIMCTPVPRLGEHTDAILKEGLGYSAQQIAHLHERGAV